MGLEKAVARISMDSVHLTNAMTGLQTAAQGHSASQPVGGGLERRVAAVEGQVLSNRDLITREILQFSK